ncbi:MAG: hypothetical protein AAFQ18_02565 [Pseudomonadota bacterium]
MKTVLTAAAFAMAVSSPAFAATMTLEFAPDDGSPAASWVFDDSTMTATAPDGSTGPYTWDEEAGVLCGTDPDGNDVCATIVMTEEAPTVGSSSTYTLNNGDTGTVTVKAMTE